MAHNGTPESVLASIALFPDALELVEEVLDQAIQRTVLGIPGAIDSLKRALHIESNCPVTPAANKILSGTSPNPVIRGYCRPYINGNNRQRPPTDFDETGVGEGGFACESGDILCANYYPSAHQESH